MVDGPLVEQPLVERLEPYGAELDERIVEATLECLARWGLAKTTLDDVARTAGCSRATVYRTFPGGKDALFEHTGQRELERFFVALARELAEVDTLEDAIVFVITEASRGVRRHAALQYLIEHECEVLLPYVSFDGIDPLLQWSAEFSAVHLSRFISPDVARDLGEWACRLVLTYSDLDFPVRVDLADPAATRAFVRSFILPGIAAMSGPAMSGPAMAGAAISPPAISPPAPSRSTIPHQPSTPFVVPTAATSGPAIATGFAPALENAQE